MLTIVVLYSQALVTELSHGFTTLCSLAGRYVVTTSEQSCGHARVFESVGESGIRPIRPVASPHICCVAWLDALLRLCDTSLSFSHQASIRAYLYKILVMALPSSPPIVAEEPPSSPPLLPTLSNTSFTGITNRKRQLSDYGSLSSDPLFSEDASDLDGDSQEGQPRRKRLVKGPWWTPGKKVGQSLRRNMAKKEGFRNVDSGVWMGSDDSIDSLKSSQARLESLEVHDKDLVFETPVNPLSAVNDPEALAHEIVTRCVENGKERVDLSDLGLAHISDATLKELDHMVRNVHHDLVHPPSEDQFSPLTPSLQLYLSGNKLSSLPPQLFRMNNLSVLSLRNNAFSELPPAISKLDQLQELNVAGNQLQWLPWELLDMIRSPDENHKLSVRPNPLLSLGLDSLDEVATEAIMSNLRQGRRACTQFEEPDIVHVERIGREHLVFLASSRIRYFDVDGSVLRFSGMRCTDGTDAWHKPTLSPQSPPETNASLRPPSMLELMLRKAQLEYSQAAMISAGDEGLPEAIVQGLVMASEGIDYGNRWCSHCRSEFLIPRAEWLEYWFHGQVTDTLCEEKILPFRRLACSWACAQITAAGTGLA